MRLLKKISEHVEEEPDLSGVSAYSHRFSYKFFAQNQRCDAATSCRLELRCYRRTLGAQVS